MSPGMDTVTLTALVTTVVGMTLLGAFHAWDRRRNERR